MGGRGDRVDGVAVVGARQPDLDALRALAALGVFASHLPWFAYYGRPSTSTPIGRLVGGAPLLGVGGFAVCVFLVISGVGITRLLVVRAPKWDAFVRARLGALFGTYWAVAIPVLVVAAALGVLALADLWKVPLWLTGLGVVSRASFAPLLGSWWYIGLALQVILVMPAVVWGLKRFGPWAVLGAAWALALTTCFALAPLGIGYAEKSLIACRGVEVVAGALLACELWPDVAAGLGITRRTAGLALGVAAVSLLGLGTVGLGGRWFYRGAAILLAAAVVYARAIERSGAKWLAAIAVAAGAVSFAFYLVHEAVIKGVWALAGGAGRVQFALGTTVALVVATLLGVLFTRGTSAARKRFGRARSLNGRDG